MEKCLNTIAFSYFFTKEEVCSKKINMLNMKYIIFLSF
jgi:hypothetical protein